MSLSAAAVRLPNVQDTFLSNLRRSAMPVTVFLMNGYQMRGTIHSFDPCLACAAHVMSTSGEELCKVQVR